MVRKSMKSVVTIVTLLIFIIPAWGYVEPFKINPGDYGLPKRMRDLTDFQLLSKSQDKRTSAEESKIILTWFSEERKTPTPTQRGMGGGDITSGYIQAQMMIRLGYSGNPLFIQEMVDNKDIEPAMRDAARIILGLMGDNSQEADLICILKNHLEPYYRAMAARALGQLGSINALSALKKAMEDPYFVKGGGSCIGYPTEHISYPVRRAASESIRNIENPEVRDIVANLSKANFKKRLGIAKTEASYGK